MVLSACAAVSEPKKPQLNLEGPGESDQLPADQPNAEAPQNPSGVELPEWFSQELKDVNTGMVFKVADFMGKVILVETLAVWCSKCLSQQKEVARLHSKLSGRDDFVSLGIDVDPNEDEPLLSGYVKKNGFNWLYAIASKEVIDPIGALYGAQYLNPTAIPMLIIDKQGNQHQLPFGIKSAEELQKALQPFFDAE